MSTNYHPAKAQRWMLGTAVMMIVSCAAAVLLYRNFPWLELSAGWILAALNAALAHTTNRKFMGAKPRMFLIGAVGGNVTRAILLFCLIVLYIRTETWETYAFLLAFLTGYSIFLFLEIHGLSALLMGEHRDERSGGNDKHGGAGN